MPISSGANDWPKEYFVKPPSSPKSAKVVVVPRPTTPIIARPAPDHTPQVLVVDQPYQPTTTTFVTRPPSPQKVVLVDQPPPPTTTYIQHVQQPQPMMMPPQHVPVVEQMVGVRRYPPGYGEYPNYGYGNYGGSSCFPDPNCCADPYFTTGVSGANAGCCQGGMFGSRVRCCRFSACGCKRVIVGVSEDVVLLSVRERSCSE